VPEAGVSPDAEHEPAGEGGAPPEFVIAGVLTAAIGSYHGARQFLVDLDRFPNGVTSEQRQLFEHAVANLHEGIGSLASRMNELALSASSIERLRARLVDPPELDLWQRWHQQLAWLQELTGRATRALRVRKSEGNFDASTKPGRDSHAPREHVAYETRKRLNRQLMALEALAGVTRPFSTPERFLFDVTNKCNFRCRTCYQSHRQTFVFYDLHRETLESLRPFLPACSVAVFAGTGEPLLSPDTPRLIRIARSYGAETELVTNGSLLARLDGLDDDISRIFISMDGASPETVDSIRRGADFAKIVAAISGLTPGLRRRIFFNMVVCRANVHEIERLAVLARELGIAELHLQTFHAYLPWHEPMKLCEEDRPFLASQIRAARAALEGSGIPLRVLFGANLDADQTSADGAAAPDHGPILAVLDRVPNPAVAEFESWEKLATDYHAATSLDVPPSLLAELTSLKNESIPARREASLPLAESEIVERIDVLCRLLAARRTIRFPHCVAPYAVMYVLGDGGVRPCCVLDRRCGSLTSEPAANVWHSRAYEKLRLSLARGVDMPKPCNGCQDGTRFALARELLEDARGLGVDMKKIELTDEACTPPAIADWLRAAGARVAGPQR
jgi:MoaA/NifB/PqqE/SkfB family radical SAM enzyme